MKRPSLSPVVWDPPVAPARARMRTGTRPLPPLQVIPITGYGPEDVVVDGEGRIITGVDDGRILRLSPDGRSIDTIADTGGRPLGVELFADGRLLVCDARAGLLAIEPDSGDVEVLVHRVDGEPMLFCNNAAVASDGTVYFTDSSRRFGIDHWMADLLEHSGTGRLLRRDPDGSVEVLRDGLQFANGVALAPDESFVAYAETGSYRLSKLWLTGSQAGQHQVLVDNMPGFPDNIATGSDGLVWVAVNSPRDPLLDRLYRMPPVFRKIVWALPEFMQPKPKQLVWVLAVDADGRIVHDLQGTSQGFPGASGVRERDGKAYLGSLASRAIAVLDLSAAHG